MTIRKNIAKARRFVNDSSLGQIINGSYAGILVEGASRAATDALESGACYLASGLAAAGAIVSAGRRRPILALSLATIAAASFIAASIEPGYQRSDTLHSHTSRLYRSTEDDYTRPDGDVDVDYMQRVPTGIALLEKLSEKRPKLAQKLALGYFNFRNSDTCS